MFFFVVNKFFFGKDKSNKLRSIGLENMEEKKRRIRITNVYTWFIIVLVISSALLLFWSYKSGQSIKAMQDQTNEYIAEQQAIDGMKDASDLLTEKSRSFIATGNVDAGKLYYKEVNEDKNREKTLEELAKYETGDEISESLNEALKEIRPEKPD